MNHTLCTSFKVDSAFWTIHANNIVIQLRISYQKEQISHILRPNLHPRNHPQTSPDGHERTFGAKENTYEDIKSISNIAMFSTVVNRNLPGEYTLIATALGSMDISSRASPLLRPKTSSSSMCSPRSSL